MSNQGKIQDVYSLTPMQEGMLFHSIADPDSQMYHELISIRLNGHMDVKAIELTLQELVKRHDILRTVFVYKNIDKPRQVVLKERNIDFSYVDIRHFSSRKEKEKYIENYKNKDRSNTFDLSKHILFRIALLQVEDEEFEFYMLHHHILLDGWSTAIFFDEFFYIYAALNDGTSIQLPPTVPFNHYIKWLQYQDKEASIEYWKEYLAGYENIASIPRRSDYHELNSSFKQKTISLTLNSTQVNQLNWFVAKNELTLYNVMKGIWGILLSKYTRQDDVVFGTVVSKRPSEIDGIEKMVGLFINTVPTRITIKPEMSFSQLFSETQKLSFMSEPHHFLSLADIQKVSELRRNLFNHILAFENYPLDKKSFAEKGQYKIRNMDVYEQANYGLSIIIMPGDEISIYFIYNENEYEDYVIQQIKSSYSCLIDQLLLNSEVSVFDAEIVTADEKENFVKSLNDTYKPLKEPLTIHGLFEQQTTHTPNATAVIEGEKEISYLHLHTLSNKVALHLNMKGIGSGSIVGIMMNQGINMAVTLLGILKAGAAFLPIDPGYPDKRILYMINDSQLQTLIYDDEQYSEYDDIEMINIYHILLEKEKPYLFQEIESSNRAYVIYTSGSTGNPKGVEISHKSVVNTLLCRKETYHINSDDVTLQLFSFSFDGFVTSFFTPLCSGAAVVLLKDEERGDPYAICDYIAHHHVTQFICIPILFKEIVHYIKEEQTQSLRLITLAGDKADRKRIDKLVAINDTIEVSQEYGVTEAAVMSTIHRNQEKDALLKIGKPGWNTNIYILDKHQKLMPMYIPGEMYIAGIGVAKGYLNNEKLTQEKFVSNPFVLNELMYKSGDLARWCKDGTIEFLGREDQQVKIRGFRIEVKEIQAALETHSDISESIIIDKKDNLGNKCLYAYYISQKQIEIKHIREFLFEILPAFMIPNYFIELSKFPLTPNGKIDINSLKSRKDKFIRTTEFVAPKTEIEIILAQIWQEVLGIERVSITDDFFKLGGDSIKSIQIRSRLNKTGYDVEFAYIFQQPTIGELAKRITSTTMETEEKSDITLPLPVMPGQLRYISMHKSNEKPLIIAGLLTCNPPISEKNFRRIFMKLYEQHDALKMKFQQISNTYYQSGNPNPPEKFMSILERIHIQNEDQLNKYIKEIAAVLDLENGPLFTANYISGNESSHVLLIGHQSIIDSASFKILFEDVGILFHQLINKTILKLPPISVSYNKAIKNYMNYYEDGSAKKDFSYWNKMIESKFENLSNIDDNLSSDIIRHYIVDMSEDIAETFPSKANQAFDTNIEDLLLTVCALSIQEITSDDKIVFYIENPARGQLFNGINNRRLPGNFQTNYPVNLTIEKTDDIGQTIKEIKEILHKVPKKGLPYLSQFITQNGDITNNEIKTPYAFILSQLDWIESEHLTFRFIEDSMQQFFFNNPEIQLVFNWKIKPDEFKLHLSCKELFFKESTMPKLIDMIKKYFSEVHECCISRNTQELTPSDFTFKDISINELDSFESFFTDE